MHGLALDWYQVKLFVQHASGMSMDALHVVAGVFLLFAIAFILRTSVARRPPLLVVLLVALINEASDFGVELWPQMAMQAGEAAKDVILTMIIPVLIFFVARHRPKLFAYKSS